MNSIDLYINSEVVQKKRKTTIHTSDLCPVFVFLEVKIPVSHVSINAEIITAPINQRCWFIFTLTQL